MPGLKYHLLGLCGHAGAGKDTVADLLVTHAGFRKLAFAEPLKGEICAAYQVEPLLFVRPELKSRAFSELALCRCLDQAFVNAVLAAMFQAAAQGAERPDAVTTMTEPRTPRQIMQWWGTEYRRAQDPDYWVKQTAARIDYYQRELREHNLVVTDVRFPNEAAALRERGALLWQVTRPGRGADSGHASATDGREFAPDVVISNSHDIRHLQQLVLGEYWALDAGLQGVEVKLS